MILSADETGPLLLSNADVMSVLDMRDAVQALRIGYDDLRDGMATYVPRIDTFAPTKDPEWFYQFGSMAGVCRSLGYFAIRMKSDVVSWPKGERQQKYAVRPGLFCGLIMMFEIDSGAPAAIIQDGYLQHLRVGAAASVGTDLLARADACVLGLLGSGGMAETYLQGIAEARTLSEVRVYSPTAANRERFAAAQTAALGIPVRAYDSAEAVVRGADIVATATDSMKPTFDPDWLMPGTHVVCVTRRELSAELLERSNVIVQLGYESIPRGVDIPFLDWKAGGMAAYVTGTAEQRAKIPAGTAAERGSYPTLLEVNAGTAAGRTDDSQISLFVNTGTQGLQFAAVGARALELCRAENLGRALPLDWFVEDIRD